MTQGFTGLMINENMKIYKRIRTWILAIIVLVVVIAAAVIIYLTQQSEKASWQERAQQQIQINQTRIQSLKERLEVLEDRNAPKQAKQGFQNEIDDLQNKIKNLQDKLDHNFNPNKGNGLTFVFNLFKNGYQFIILLAVIIASDIVASEFNWGSIKMLMIRPHRRWSILLSKYISAILFMLLLFIEFFVLSWLIGGMVFGFDSLGSADESIGNQLTDIFQLFKLQFLGGVMMVTIAFMVSTLLRSSGLAIGISIFALFMMSTVGVLLSFYEWTKYLLFANVDLIQYFQHSTGMIEGTTLPFSLLIDLGYWAIFMIVTWWVFMKRDIAN